MKFDFRRDKRVVQPAVLGYACARRWTTEVFNSLPQNPKP